MLLGYKSGEGMSPPSAPESSEGSPGMAGDPSLLDGIPTLDELLACDAGLPGDLGDLSSFLDSIPPPAIPDQQNVATLGCATSVLKGTPVSSTPASPQSTPSKSSLLLVVVATAAVGRLLILQEAPVCDTTSCYLDWEV